MNLVLWRHLPTLQNSWWLWRAQQQSFRISHVAVTQKQESAAAEINPPTTLLRLELGGLEMGKGEGDPVIVSLVEWAESNGAVVQGVRLRGRRFYASEDLPEGHIVFSVPFSLLVTP